MKVNNVLLALGLLLFIGLFGASIWKQSPVLLYIASALPIFVVPFLPDIRTSQKLNSNKQSAQTVKLTDASGEEADWLVITFQPGTVYWNKKWLVIPTQGVTSVSEIHTDDYTVSLPVLKYDLRTKKKRNGQISIYLPNLLERTQSLSFTVDEVSRLMIRMDDLEDLLPRPSSAPVAAPAVLNSTTNTSA